MSNYTRIPNTEPVSNAPARQYRRDNVPADFISPEHAPLLGSSVISSSPYQDEEEEEIEAIVSPIPTGTFFGSTVNLANTILGTGMLAMPSAIASIGLIPGMMMILFSACASSLGLYFLSLCAARTSARDASFFTISKHTYPKAAIFFDLAIAIKCFGVSVSYLIILGDLMPQVVQMLFDTVANAHPFLVDRRFWISVLMMVIAPMAFLRKLDSLKYTSLVALFAVAYLVAIVLWYFIVPSAPPPPPGDVEWVTFSSKFLKALPLFVFGFTCHQNIFSVYNELGDNSQPKVNSVIVTSIFSAAGVYETIGVLGYICFGKDVLPNVILEYPSSLFVTIGRLAIVVLVLFSYALQAHPARASLDKVLSATSLGLKASPNAKYVFLTMGILISSYLIAMAVSKLDLVLAIVGSTGSTTISFILPGIFYTKLTQGERWDTRRVLATALASYGCVVMTICLSYNVFHLWDAEAHFFSTL